MNERAFVIAGDQAALIANDVDDFRYRAAVHYVPVGVQVPMRSHGATETQFLLEDGTLEFMVGGAATLLAAPNFVRGAAGSPLCLPQRRRSHRPAPCACRAARADLQDGPRLHRIRRLS